MDVTQQVQELIFASERSKNACRTYSYTEVKYDIWLGWLKWYAVLGKSLSWWIVLFSVVSKNWRFST